MIRYYLGEEPILENVPTYLLADRRAARVGARAPRRGRGQADERVRRQGRVHRPDRDRRGDRAARPRRSCAAPERWIAQELVRLSTCPTAAPDGTLVAAPRRPAPVRRVRRGHPHRPRRADARRAARGVDDRQLLPGRRLEGHVGARGRRRPARRRDFAGAAAWSPPRMPGLPPGGDEWTGQQQQQQQQHIARAAPGSPTSCTGSAASSRAPSTPRACSTASSTPTSRAARTTPAGVQLSWDALLTIMGSASRATSRPRATRSCACSRSTPTYPASVLACVTRAREGARTVRDVVQRRDVGGDQHVPPRAAAARHLGRAAHRPVLRLRLRARALRAVLGRHEPHDAARRGARVPARPARRSRPPTWCCGCCASRCRPTPTAPRSTCATARRSRCCRPSAASRPTGAPCPAPPNARPVARFLLFERDYPDSVASSVEALHAALTAADPSYRNSPPVLRLGRLVADLDFRARAGGATRAVRHARQSSSASWRRSTPTSPSATSAAPRRRSPD